jgi:hypothetical protein
MDYLVDRANHLAMSHFKCSAKKFIEKGLKKGRHYFYLRDALGFTSKKFDKLMLALNIRYRKS